ncbi:MAG: sigma-70 family RNA polymerase sigma factor [Planctomycetales bacterium]|nr:sigma-70 family RNA polymerase sigma factor [Planctomycetales bacterium]
MSNPDEKWTQPRGPDSISGIVLEQDSRCSQALFASIYEELYKLANDRLRHEVPGHTLQPTALINEVFLRLVAPDGMRLWDSKAHFFAAAARAMRQILIDSARRKHAQKRFPHAIRVDFPMDEAEHVFDDTALLALHDALTELEKLDPVKGRLIELRFFAGLDNEQICELLEISRATAHRYWTQARAWLFLRISGQETT